MQKFIDCYKNTEVPTKYHAGKVKKYEDGYMIAYETKGAAETFSIGQPVYDEDGKLMGYLGIGMYAYLDYVAEGVEIPVEHWVICLPTSYCVEGKTVYTYWQNKERIAKLKDKGEE